MDSQHSQQPMSLMTISTANFRSSTPASKQMTVGGGGNTSTNADDDDDLLTLRILEASERKMMMIKELLSAEEYESLAPDLFASPIEFEQRLRNQPEHLERKRTRYNRLLGGERTEATDTTIMAAAIEDADHNEPQRWHRTVDIEAGGARSGPPFAGGTGDYDEERRESPTTQTSYTMQKSKSHHNLSTSESNLGRHRSRVTSTGAGGDIKENLDKRRRAIEFFFGGADRPGVTGIPTTNLATESRFGYYLEVDLDTEKRLLDLHGRTLSGLPYFWAVFLNLIASLMKMLFNDGNSPLEELKVDETMAGDEDVSKRRRANEIKLTKFVERHKKFNSGPYNRKANMLALAERLRADKQLEKLLDSSICPEPSKRAQTRQTRQDHPIIISIANSANNKLKLIGLENKLQSPSWIATRSRPASVMAIDHLGASRILLNHPSIEQLAQAGRQISESLCRHLEPANASKQRRRVSNRSVTSSSWPSVELRFERISVVQHKLMQHEVRLAKKLVELHEQHEELVRLMKRIKRLADKLSLDFINQLDHHHHGEDETSPATGDVAAADSNRGSFTSRLTKSFDRLLKMLELKYNLVTRISMKQLRLSMVWSELETVRSSQGFNLTSCTLETHQLEAGAKAQTRKEDSGEQGVQKQTTLLQRLLQSIEASFGLDQRESFAKQLERLHKLMEIEQAHQQRDGSLDDSGRVARVELNWAGLERSPSREVPNDELERKEKLNEWLKSINFVIQPLSNCCNEEQPNLGAKQLANLTLNSSSTTIDDLYTLNLAAAARDKQQDSAAGKVDTSSSMRLTLASSSLPNEIRLRIRVFQCESAWSRLANISPGGRRLLRQATLAIPIERDAGLLNGMVRPIRQRYEIQLDLQAGRGESDELGGDSELKARVSLEFSVLCSLAGSGNGSGVGSNDNDAEAIGNLVTRTMRGDSLVSRAELARRMLVDRLYACFFVAERNPFENTQTKLAKLLNRIERRTLVAVMAELGLDTRAFRALVQPYCVIEPFLASLQPNKDCSSSLANFKPASLRCALLALRWTSQELNKWQQQAGDDKQQQQLATASSTGSALVCLSERENLHKINAIQFDTSTSKQLHEFRMKLAGTMSNAKKPELAGHNAIEHTRRLAVDYIHRLEQLIEQILEAHYSVLADTNQEPTGTTTTTGLADRGRGRPNDATGHQRRRQMTARDLLIEPTVTLRRPEMISLDVGPLLRALVPRPTARRPLMPKRRQHQENGIGGGSRLGHLVEQARLAASIKTGAKAATGNELDAAAIGQWWRFGANGTTGNNRPDSAGSGSDSGSSLRLIVTIQQATNVPFRAIVSPPTAPNAQMLTMRQQQQHQLFLSGSPMPVSGSPFLSPSPMFGAGPGSSPHLGVTGGVPTMQHRLLVPATTYVEAIFQRKQLASSLAQGKNPAWNETLFFSVDLANVTNETTANVGTLAPSVAAPGGPQVQLVDEFLQLNLYDCRSFHLDQNGASETPTLHLESQWPLLDGTSSTGNPFGAQLDPQLGGANANRLLVAQRRIERHLIGSLRIPMSALLTTGGRVEGSFPLSQPLLLDNYHYEPEPMMMQFQQQLPISRHHQLFGADAAAQGTAGEIEPPLGDELAYSTSDSLSRTHLSLFITLDPPISLPFSVQLPTGSHERADLFELAKLWEQTMLRFVPAPIGAGTGAGGASIMTNRSRFLSANRGHHHHNLQQQEHSLRHSAAAPNRSTMTLAQRHIRALVLRDDARYQLACRYLRPMQPPKSLMEPTGDGGPLQHTADDNQDQGQYSYQAEEQRQQHQFATLNSDYERDDQMRRLARFVSLLRPLKYGLFNMRLLAASLWFDSEQLLAGQLGGHEEKAVLLCNYFLWLGKCSALLLGDSLQSGRCVYVLVWSEQLKSGAVGQLELQMDELMNELAQPGVASRPTTSLSGSADTATGQQQQQQQSRWGHPVDQSNFIARLPILINSRSCYLWDPCQGVRYDLGGPRAHSNRAGPLPLISVDSIVTVENVYANMQPMPAPTGSLSTASSPISRLSFDIRQKNLWFPLFSSRVGPPPGNQHQQEAAQSGAAAEQVVDSNLATIKRDSRRLAQMSWRKKLAHLELLARLVGRPPPPPAPISRPMMASNDSSSQLHAPADGISGASAIYDSFTPAQCQELKDQLERSIKSHLLMWRPTRPTYFNRTLSRIIAEKLASFERRILSTPTGQQLSQLDDSSGSPNANTTTNTTKTTATTTRQQTGTDERLDDLNRRRMATSPDWWRTELAELIRAETLSVGAGYQHHQSPERQMISWPVNLAYTSMQAIIDGFYASGVHNADLVLENSTPAVSAAGEPAQQPPSSNLSTQFLVAAHVEPYPARVMSVWLYVGALVTTSQAQASTRMI